VCVCVKSQNSEVSQEYFCVCVCVCVVVVAVVVKEW